VIDVDVGQRRNAGDDDGDDIDDVVDNIYDFSGGN